MRVHGEIFGDWDKFAQTLNALQDNTEAYKTVVRQMGAEIVERIWDLIESQSIDLEPLVEEYRRQKVFEGYDERILIRTGNFLNSINVTDIKVSGYDIEVKIGVDGGTTETGLSMHELASFLEYGTSKMQGREPFRKSWDAMKEDVKGEIMSQLKGIILEDL